MALITKLNKPKVISVIGKDNMCKMGPTNIFKMDKTKLANIAEKKLLT